MGHRPNKGETLTGNVLVASKSASGPYIFRLLLPDGAVCGTCTWTVSLAPGAQVTVPASFVVPAAGRPFTPYFATVIAFPAGAAVEEQADTFQFVVMR